MNEMSHSTSLDTLLRFQGQLSEADVLHVWQYKTHLFIPRKERWTTGASMLFGACFAWMFQLWFGWIALVWVALFLLLWVYLLFTPWDVRRAARRHYRLHKAQYVESQVSLTSGPHHHRERTAAGIPSVATDWSGGRDT